MEFKTQRYSTRVDVLSFSDTCGATTDLAHPDREMVASKVEAKHSGPLGALLGDTVSHVTCHLKRVTDRASVLYRPTSALQLLQMTWRNFPENASPMARELVLHVSSDVEEENWTMLVCEAVMDACASSKMFLVESSETHSSGSAEDVERKTLTAPGDPIHTWGGFAEEGRSPQSGNSMTLFLGNCIGDHANGRLFQPAWPPSSSPLRVVEGSHEIANRRQDSPTNHDNLIPRT